MSRRKALGTFLCFVGATMLAVPLYAWLQVPQTTAMQVFVVLWKQGFTAVALLALGAYYLGD